MFATVLWVACESSDAALGRLSTWLEVLIQLSLLDHHYIESGAQRAGIRAELTGGALTERLPGGEKLLHYSFEVKFKKNKRSEIAVFALWPFRDFKGYLIVNLSTSSSDITFTHFTELQCCQPQAL